MKKIISILIAALMLVSVIPAVTAAGELPFKDVTEKKWFYTDVKYVYDNGLMNGMTENTFEPTKSMSRSMFVTVLGRLCGAVEHDTGKFPDVKKGSWYAGYVGWASENGIVGGYTDGMFKPDKTITREEAAAVIDRFIGFIGMLPTWDVTAPSSFSDVKKIGSWARESVDSLRTSGIIAGNNGNFDPKKTLSRAEAATILARLHRMKENLRLDDPIEKSYLTGDGKLHFLGAWDLYYSGTALNSGYNGTKVDDTCKTPLLVGDDEGRTFRFQSGNVLERQKSGVAEGYWYSLDTKILNVKLTEYPIVKFCTNASSAEIGIELSGGTSAKVKSAYANGDVTADLSQYAAASDTADYSIVSVMSEEDFGIFYVGFFKNEADAETFSTGDYNIDLSKPTENRIDFTVGDERTIAEYNAMVDERIDEIKNLPDLDPADFNTCYYMSSIRGDDKNDGLSPDRPVKTAAALYDYKGNGTIVIPKVVPGDAVFIERGSVYNGLEAEPGVTYSPYGEGEKPIFTRALDINGSMDWVETKYENVWKLNEKVEGDVGNIAFKKDGVDGWGTKIITTVPNNTFKEELPTIDNGIVSTGFEVYECPSRLCRDESVLEHNLEFIVDFENDVLYLYFDKGNPGKYFDSIIAAMDTDTVWIKHNPSGVTTRLHNLSVRHSGCHGISISQAKDVSITGCEVLWTGGCIQFDNTRYGNGIENWGYCDRLNISDCYIYQAYDAGLTTQASGLEVMQNAYFRDNVLEYCNMTLEFFTGGGTEGTGFYNTFFTGNMIRYAGLGLGSHTPRWERKGSFMWTWSADFPVENFVFEDNLCLYPTSVSFRDGGIAKGDHTRGRIYRNNTYVIDRTNGYHYLGVYNMSTGHSSCYWPATEQYLQYLGDMGIDVGAHFIAYDGYFNDDLAEGAYRFPEK